MAGGRASATGAAPGTCSAVYAAQLAWGQPPGAPRLQALPRCKHNVQARTRTQDGSACMGRTHLCTSPCTQLGSAPGAWLAYLRRQLADLADAQDSSAGLRNAVGLSREGDNTSVIPFQQMGGSRTPGEAIGRRLLMWLPIAALGAALRIEGSNAVPQEHLFHARAIQSRGDNQQWRKSSSRTVGRNGLRMGCIWPWKTDHQEDLCRLSM
jgi:hypothetical protein